jgi:hypothetical protein
MWNQNDIILIALGRWLMSGGDSMTFTLPLVGWLALRLMASVAAFEVLAVGSRYEIVVRAMNLAGAVVGVTL